MIGAVRLLEGHVLDRLAEMPDESIHCVVTSPPYWGLRDYGLPAQVWPDGWRGSLGLEPTPELFVEHMVAVFREVRRVLRSDGCCWINLGDSFASGKGTCYNPGGGAESLGQVRKAEGVHPLDRGSVTSLRRSGLKPKDLIGIPWRVAFALQADGWWLRSDVIWSKPNPMPESVTDRPTKAHEYVFLLTKSARYFFDADAVREPHKRLWDESNGGSATNGMTPRVGLSDGRDYPLPNPAGRNLRSVWTIATAPYPEAHFATFPPKLVEPCIRAGTSEHGVCPECGAPWARQTTVTSNTDPDERVAALKRAEDAGIGRQRAGSGLHAYSPTVETTGWLPSCECFVLVGTSGKRRPFPPAPATVLDPFAGSGTVGQVCIQERRNFIGIELNPEYCKLAERRTSGVQVRAF